MQIKKKNLAVNAVLNTVKTVLGIIFPLITFPYISRVLGVKKVGIYNFSSSIVSYFILIAGLGVSTYAIREATQYRENPEKIEKFVSEVFSINVISTIISYVLLFLLVLFVPKFKNYQFPILVLSIEILFRTIGVPWLCNIYEDFLFITIRTLMIQILSLLGTFIFVRSRKDLYIYIIIVAVANSAANIFNFFYVKKRYCNIKITLHCNFKQHLKPILIIFSTSVAITLYVSSDTTMLGLIKDDIQVGLYSTSVKIYTIAKNVLSAILMVLIPRFSILFSKKMIKEAEDLLSDIFNILTTIMFPLVTGLIFLSKDVILFISGKDYVEANVSLMLLSCASIFSLYSYLNVQCILLPLKKEKVVFYATLISAVLNIILNLILMPKWGINAAAFTTIVAEATVWIISFLVGKKSAMIKFNIRDIISCFTGCIVIGFICVLIENIMSGITALLIAFILSVLAYSLILLVFRNSLMIQTLKKVKSRF